MEMDIKNMAIIAVIALVIIAGGAFAYLSMTKTVTKIEITCNDTIQNGDYISVILKDDYRNVIPDQIIDLKILDDSGWAHKYNVNNPSLVVVSKEEYIYKYDVIDNLSDNGTLFLKESHSNRAFQVNDGYSY